MVVNKQDFINQLVTKYGYQNASANYLVDDFWKCLLDNLEAGNSVSFHGIGRFDLVTHAEKRFFNPSTGKTSITPSHCVLRFSPGKSLCRIARKRQPATRCALERSGSL